MKLLFALLIVLGICGCSHKPAKTKWPTLISAYVDCTGGMLSPEGVKIRLQYHVLVVKPKDCGPTLKYVQVPTK